MKPLLCALIFAFTLAAQNETGELRLSVTDPTGLPVPASVELLSSSNQFRQSAETGAEGKLIARRLPFGLYQLRVTRTGFAAWAGTIEIRSAIPRDYAVTLRVAPIETAVVVSESATLVDPHRTGSNHRIGAGDLRDRAASQPGRSVVDLVNSQPGWLLEANAVLHPRGSEYQTQYVINGVPVTDNRSPSFAPEIEADDVQSMNVLTANYPAEYGRKLGGIIEVTTVRNAPPGLRGRLAASGGSFDTAGGYAMAQYGWARQSLSLSGNAARTNRYLDPPVEANYTNQGSAGSLAAHYEADFTPADRIGLVLRRDQSRFLVPNEQPQQDVHQRQDRNSYEIFGQLSFQHIFSPNLLGDLRFMGRDLSAALWSNALSTPIIAMQDRGFRHVYFKAALSLHHGRHEIKTGVEADFGSLREAFSYRITNRRAFDRDTARTFNFSDRRQDREQALFLQDLIRLGNWTVSAGLRWDHYRLMIDENAPSPRLGVAWHLPSAGLVLRASYDRVFQTPAFENLLLASSPAVAVLNDEVLRLPVRPSSGNFFEAGFTKGLFGKLRLDANWFRREASNFADDDLLLNTGVTFPIAFRHAEIQGFEAKLELPRWNIFSGFLGYSNLHGVEYLPVTGGFFLGDEAGELLESTDRFPVTQDQRNTARGRIRAQILPRLWTALAASYGSGLPVEFEGDPEDAVEQYGERIASRVNFSRGRVRPNFSLDLSAGLDLLHRDRRSLRLQADIQNLTNRLNLLNFAGLFSGTALAAPRSLTLRMSIDF